MKITYLLGWRRVWMLFKIISEIDLTGKRFKILFRDTHSRIVKITAAKQNVDFIFVESVKLFADQSIAELDHSQRVKFGMICKFREQKLIIRQYFLENKDAVGKSPVKIAVEFTKAEFERKTVCVIQHDFVPFLI